MRKLLRFAAMAVTGLSLTTGVAAANSGSIGTTGQNSNNTIEFSNSDTRRVENNSDVKVRNSNPQTARSGEVNTDRNTTAGTSQSGNARNDSLLRANLTVNNTSSSSTPEDTDDGDDMGTISNTGQRSENHITFDSSSDSRVTNNSTVHVVNENEQRATTGNVNVSRNTTAGNALSGHAENISTTEVTVNVSN